MVRSALRSAFVPALLACAAAVLSPATASAQLKVGIVNFQQHKLSYADPLEMSFALRAYRRSVETMDEESR